LKIGHVLAYPYHGGIQEYVFNLVKEQSKKHDVTVFTSKCSDIREVPNVKYYQNYPFLSIFRTPFTPTLSKKIMETDLDVIHVHFPFPLSSDLACLFGQIKKCAVIVTYHCEIDLDVSLSRLRYIYWGAKKFNDCFLSEALRASDGIIVTTPRFFKTSRILKRFADKVDIIPIGVDLSRFKPNYNYPKRLLFVGRIIPEKGLEYLIRSLKYVDAELEVVGKPVVESYYQHLLKLTEQLGLSSRVHFAGYVPDAELPKHYADAGVIVLPSISRLEAFGIAVLEGFASGKPATVTDLPGPSSLVRDGRGLVVPTRNPEAIAKAVNEIFENGRAEEMGRRARKFVEEEYAWTSVAERIEKLYLKSFDA
jgi:glycosyltransferase involved in cell wall biosynthesis